MKTSTGDGLRTDESAPERAELSSDAEEPRVFQEEGSDDPIVCHWELGPEELPEFHRIVRTYERTAPTKLVPSASEAPPEHRRSSTFAPVVVIAPKGVEAASASSRFRRRLGSRAAYAVLLSGAVTVAIITLQIEQPQVVPVGRATGLLTTRALGALDSRAAALDAPEGSGEPALLDDALAEPAPRIPSAQTRRPGASSVPAVDGIPGATVDQAAGSAPAVLLNHTAVVSTAAPTQHGRPANPARANTKQPLDDSYPPDETEVTWLERQQAAQRSTDEQTPPTALHPNRGFAERHPHAVRSPR